MDAKSRRRGDVRVRDRRGAGHGVGRAGFVSLEIAGNYASMSIDPDQVFEIQLATLTA